MIDTRLYSPGDFPTISPWFTGHGGSPVPEKILPKCGVVAVLNGQPVAAVWLYMDNSVGVAWLAWLVTSPELPLFTAEEALRVLLGAAEAVAKSLDYGLLFTMTNKPALGRWFKGHGFAPNDSGSTQYFKPL